MACVPVAGCRDDEQYRRETGTPPTPDLMFENVSEAVNFDLEYRALAEPVFSSIQRVIRPTSMPILVGVCGRSRAGKTVAAHAIVRALTENENACLHVRLDDWIVPMIERKATCSAEDRNRVVALPGIVQALRAGASVRAPGYDARSRGQGQPVTYDPTGRTIIVLEGSFAGHRSIRPMLDFTVFVTVSEVVQHSRFAAFYRWKGLDQKAIGKLWRERTEDEWPAVDEQRDAADFVMTLGAAQ